MLLTSPLAAQGHPSPFSWSRFVAGGVASLLAHEVAHVVTAVAVGGSPSFGFDQGRPVVYSGVNVDRHPGDQFAFSASGMAVQLLFNEWILLTARGDEPFHAFERGVLAAGIGTVVFYFSVGRRAEVGDVYHMASTSGLSPWTLTALYGGVAAGEVIRIVLRQRHARFFAGPGESGSVRFGMTVDY